MSCFKHVSIGKLTVLSGLSELPGPSNLVFCVQLLLAKSQATSAQVLIQIQVNSIKISYKKITKNLPSSYFKEDKKKFESIVTQMR